MFSFVFNDKSVLATVILQATIQNKALLKCLEMYPEEGMNMAESNSTQSGWFWTLTPPNQALLLSIRMHDKNLVPTHRMKHRGTMTRRGIPITQAETGVPDPTPQGIPGGHPFISLFFYSFHTHVEVTPITTDLLETYWVDCLKLSLFCVYY